MSSLLSDTTAPVLTLSMLANGVHTSVKTLNVSGIASDDTELAAVTVDGVAVSADTDGLFTTMLGLLPGTNIITISAIDGVGNRSSETRTIVLDQQAPEILITNPADNSKTAQGTITLSGSVDETAEVTVTDQNDILYVPNRSGDSFTVDVTLAEGMNTLTVTAVDLAGKSGSVKRTVIYKAARPGLAVTSPNEDTLLRTVELTLSGIVSAADPAVTVSLTADGQTYTPAVAEDGSFSQTLTFAEEGTYPLVVTAQDELGHTTSVTRTILYTRGLIAIQQGAAVTGVATVKLGLDYYPSATKMRFCANNATWTAWEPFAATKTVTVSSGDGLKTVYVQFLGNDGKPSEIYFDSITLDSKAPTGSLTINSGAAAAETLTVTLSLVLAEAEAGVQMQFSNNQTVWSPWEPWAATKSWTLAGTAGTAGSKTVYARFKDSVGKVSAVVSDNILYQAGSPVGGSDGVLTINNGATYTTTTAATLQFANVAAEYTQLALSGNGSTWTAWEAVKASRAYTLAVGDGVKTVYVRFRTATGAVSAIYSDTIIFDSKPPTGSLVINGGSPVTRNPLMTLTLQAADLNGVTHMQISESSTSWGGWLPFSTSATFDFANDGAKTVYARFKDSAGKISPAVSDGITLDRVAPVGKVAINAGASIITSLQVTLTLSAPGAILMQLSLDNGTTWGRWEPFVTGKTVTLPAGDGAKSVKARFRDPAGNESTVVSSNKATYTTSAAPRTLAVPPSDADGSYLVLWSTVGAGYTYTLEEATSADFSVGRRVAYSGTALSYNISLRSKGESYYYRVRAVRAGLAPSGWTSGGVACKVGALVAPGSLTVPVSALDGNYTVTWGASVSPGVSYVLEEATNAAFSENVQTVYSGGGRSCSVTGRSSGMTYYYRVKVRKSDFTDSSWKGGANGCKVGSLAPPSGLLVPVSDNDGSYTVSWGASVTPGVTYAVQEATDSAFTLGLRTLSVAGPSLEISGRVAGKTYYYRVRSTKAGFAATSWLTAVNGCQILP